jgi:predicted TIM-barrel enzyme
VSVDNSRRGILKRFRAQVARGEPIIGGGAGTGLSAKSEEAGGIDLLIVYNSGRYRMAGRGSSAGLLAYGNANQIVKEMAYEVLPVVKQTPVLAGVNGTDPFMIPKLFLGELRALGFAGIQNFPTVGLFDGDMRQAFEETGMSYQLEVDIIRLASRMDMLTTPYVFNPPEAERMADAGADLIVAHMGVTTGGSIGAKSSKTLDDCVTRIQDIADAARGVNPDVLVICHGGPISEPPDAEYIISNCRGVDGFYGASSVERLPAERAIASQIEVFKRIRLPAARSRSAGALAGSKLRRVSKTAGKAGRR